MKKLLSIIIALSATLQVFAGRGINFGTDNVYLEKNIYAGDENISFLFSNNIWPDSWEYGSRSYIKAWETLDYSINGGEYMSCSSTPFQTQVNEYGLVLSNAKVLGEDHKFLFMIIRNTD